VGVSVKGKEKREKHYRHKAGRKEEKIDPNCVGGVQDSTMGGEIQCAY